MEQLCFQTVPLEQNPGAKPLMCIGLIEIDLLNYYLENLPGKLGIYLNKNLQLVI